MGVGWSREEEERGEGSWQRRLSYGDPPSGTTSSAIAYAFLNAMFGTDAACARYSRRVSLYACAMLCPVLSFDTMPCLVLTSDVRWPGADIKRVVTRLLTLVLDGVDESVDALAVCSPPI